MTKKLTWEVNKTSLVLKVTDGPKETTWTLRKSTKNEDLRQILEEMQLALWVPGHRLMEEEGDQSMKDLEASQKAWEESSSVSVDAVSEEGSMEALRAKASMLKANARWMDVDEDEVYTVTIPDYDNGEV